MEPQNDVKTPRCRRSTGDIARDLCVAKGRNAALNHRILSQNAAPESVSSNLVGSVLALDMLIERLEARPRVVLPVEFAAQQPA